jgi:hypothetical protein
MSDNCDVDEETIVRHWKVIVGPLICFAAVVALFVGHIAGGPSSVRVLSAVLVIVSVAFIYRSTRAGYIEVSKNTVIVRTMFRTTEISRESIQSVLPTEVMQVTPRVFPVITLKNGTKYNMSEFFSQRRSYYKNTEQSIVTKAIRAIEG